MKLAFSLRPYSYLFWKITHEEIAFADPSQFIDEQLTQYMNHSNCLRNMRTRLKDKCITDLNAKCSNMKLIAYKALRISMEAVQNILEKDPDTHVIYFVRDPRATAFSTQEAGLMSRFSGGQVIQDVKLTLNISSRYCILNLFKAASQYFCFCLTRPFWSQRSLTSCSRFDLMGYHRSSLTWDHCVDWEDANVTLNAYINIYCEAIYLVASEYYFGWIKSWIYDVDSGLYHV